jgi:hypothetical protein
MSPRTLERSLWMLASTLLAIAIVGAAREARSSASGHGDALPEADVLVSPSAPPEQELTTTVDHDPFRLERHPSPIGYKPELEGVAPPPPPPKQPHPLLTLSGILGGPPWDALLDGVPGHDGSTLVHQGDVIGTLKIRSVSRDSVVITGEDTTWRLGLKKVWQ